VQIKEKVLVVDFIFLTANM